MRLIDGDRLEDALREHKFDYSGETEYNDGVVEGLMMARDDVIEAPTIEAVPVKHGKWIPSDPPDAPVTKLYKCSVCGLGYEDDDTDCEVYYPWKYCPHCGAIMEIEDDSAEEC